MEQFEFLAAILYELFQSFGRILIVLGFILCVASALVLHNQALFFIGFTFLGGALILLALAWLLRHFDRLPP